MIGAAVRPWARHLSGVDLSPLMLEQARQRGVYDQLIQAELTSFLQTERHLFDVIVCADTFIYFGALSPAFAGAYRCLKQGGHFIFTVEHNDEQAFDDDYVLLPHGRYSHGEKYVRRCVEDAGMKVVDVKQTIIRRELRDAVAALIVTAIRP